MLIARARILMRDFCNTRSDFHMEKTVLYEKHFQHVFTAVDWKLVPDPLIFIKNDKIARCGHF